MSHPPKAKGNCKKLEGFHWWAVVEKRTWDFVIQNLRSSRQDVHLSWMWSIQKSVIVIVVSQRLYVSNDNNDTQHDKHELQIQLWTTRL
jgi:hypothetical protein